MIIKKFKKRLLTSIALFITIFLILHYNFLLLFALIIFGVLSILEFFNIIKKITKNNFIKLTQNLMFVLYVFIFCLLFFVFSEIIQLKIILFIILFGCIASDIGGFIVGKTLKGPKLTRISPNKTISGSLGSIVFTIVVMNLLFLFFLNMSSLSLIAISLFTSIGCQVGDLFFSYLKRKAKIKDTGNLLPGHGGILDRLDGIFLGIPVGFLSLNLFY
mgnify:CR=1 FL=1|tara:strand:- start:1293 stop:1943 length:651 start_codon:yes stop_codon:yes gene_type:complete